MSRIDDMVYAQHYNAFVVCAPQDEETARLIIEGLRAHRRWAAWDSRINRAIQDRSLSADAVEIVARWKGDTLIVLWSSHLAQAPALAEVVKQCRDRGLNVLVATLDGSEPVDDLIGATRVDLRGWTSDGSYPSFGLHEPRISSPSAPPRPPVPPTAFNALLTDIPMSSHGWSRPENWITDVNRPTTTLQPVHLGVAAPRTCEPGGVFSAVFASYIESAKDAVKETLQSLTDPGDPVALGLTPATARWKVGAPVTVRLTGQHLTVTPPHQQFEFNGSHNILAFAVQVERNVAPTAILMCFEVLMEGVPTAFIPLRLRIASGAVDAVSHSLEVKAPTSAFASYSSKDATEVAGRLSSLTRWQPDLDVFMDCLDLVPNEAFKPVLKQQISEREFFLLFWSRNAAASPWVRWELATALAAKGASRFEKILPMPLEDPAIAPMPPEFGDQHQRDKFMVAAYGLERIRQELARAPAS